jgi:hypothetical protein
MRVGIISPNLLLNSYPDAKDADEYFPWEMDSLGKKAALLFDKLYLTHDLEMTSEIIGSTSGEFENDPRNVTLRYLVKRGLIVRPEDLGFSSTDEFIKSSLKGAAAKIHLQLVRVGNPSIEDGSEFIGQPDVGDFAAHDGWHPRAKRGRGAAQILLAQRKYESLLLRRNAAMLRQSGLEETAVVASLFEERKTKELSHPVWKVLLREMPDLDTRAPWEDVLGFRSEERTQHLIRSLRRWIRKIVAEEWTETALQDEVRELIFEYESHLKVARLSGGKGVLEVLITGAAELAENVVKLRFGKIAKLASAMINRKVKLLEEEAKAPGRELALLPEMKLRF